MKVWRAAVTAAISIAGIAVLIVGIALIFLPGPGLLLIVVGLGLLASEHRWLKLRLRKLVLKTNSAQARKLADKWLRDK